MAKKTTPGFEETNEDIVMGLADAQTQIASVETLVNEWKKAGESTPKNVICWTEPWVWIVPARDGFTSLSALQAIETVNRLLQTWHPPKGYQAKEVRVLQNVGNLLFCLTTPDHNSNSRPLPPLVLADWGEVMVLYHELADKLMAAAKPEFACAVYGAAFTHDPDLIYSDRTMETFEMAALMAGKAEVPFFGMPPTNISGKPGSRGSGPARCRRCSTAIQLWSTIRSPTRTGARWWWGRWCWHRNQPASTRPKANGRQSSFPARCRANSPSLMPISSFSPPPPSSR